jgi:hypothetical protein
MIHKARRFSIAFTVAIVLALSIVAIAAAITIVVDGIKEPTWGGSGGQVPGAVLDPNEAAIDDRYDIKVISYTNDALGSAPWGHLYFLFESYSNFDSIYPVATPQIIVCMDVDNKTSTGTTASGYCNDMAGIDRRIYFFPSLGTVTVQRWNGAAFVVVPQPSGGMRAVAYDDPSASGIADMPYIEGGVDLQSLGIINTATCIGNMQVAVYYDNGIIDGEDQIPDSGTFNMSCGNPTAVTLNSLQAQPVNTSPLLPLALVGGAAVILIGAVFFTRRSRKHTA